MPNTEEVYGTVLTFKHDKGSLSAPAFTDILIETEAGKYVVFAQGKLAKQISPKLVIGLRVTLTLMGDQILIFEAFGE